MGIPTEIVKKIAKGIVYSVEIVEEGSKKTFTILPSKSGALAGVVAGAAAGKLIPGISTATGAVIGAIIGLVIGMIFGAP